jgi:hypothetical protein
MADTKAPVHGLTDWQEEQLNRDIENDEISWLDQGRGVSVPFLPLHHYIREANRIFGFGGWEMTTEDLSLVGEWPVFRHGGRDYPDKVGIVVAYRARVRVTVHTDAGPRSSVGCGFCSSVAYRYDNEIPDTCDPSQAHEVALKGAESDALKRALRNWGDRFGLSLYDKDNRPQAQTQPRKGGQGRQGGRGQPADQPEQGGGKPELTTLGDLMTAMLKAGVKGRVAVEAVRDRAGYQGIPLEDLGPNEYREIYGLALMEMEAQ